MCTGPPFYNLSHSLSYGLEAGLAISIAKHGPGWDDALKNKQGVGLGCRFGLLRSLAFAFGLVRGWKPELCGIRRKRMRCFAFHPNVDWPIAIITRLGDGEIDANQGCRLACR